MECAAETSTDWYNDYPEMIVVMWFYMKIQILRKYLENATYRTILNPRIPLPGT